MVSWPALGTRVTVRYRRPTGSVPPLTDVVGHLLAVDPVVRVRTKTGAVVECAPADVVALRELTDAPVRTSEIRALERAAAAARPGDERAWLDGWLLRAGKGGGGLAANSAMPLDVSADASAIGGIVAWYAARGLTPRLGIPDRLLPVPPGWVCELVERVMVRDVEPGAPPGSQADVAVDAERHADVSDAPDGTRWVGLSLAGAQDTARGAALLAWGASRGATRGYLRVHDAEGAALAGALGFRLHHHTRYFPLGSPTGPAR
ncbi:GCN5 family acetyltransferase [Mycobacterium alsense]|uniref:GCN5 family acetyltransferase n=1 Tax=Mycobacterium alsense TaxID=324058 RepID=A0ABD6NU76_9MYCO|nr:GCN5 family acetyltransferase [Mycobacterium alsense]OBG26864.1 GCN5 family acetyltransferase [Mycobacterium alsense]